MNRQQAEHILDAYVQTVKFVDDEEPSVALREVILDVMTSCEPCRVIVSNAHYPLPSQTPPWTVTCSTGVSE